MSVMSFCCHGNVSVELRLKSASSHLKVVKFIYTKAELMEILIVILLHIADVIFFINFNNEKVQV